MKLLLPESRSQHVRFAYQPLELCTCNQSIRDRPPCQAASLCLSPIRTLWGIGLASLATPCLACLGKQGRHLVWLPCFALTPPLPEAAAVPLAKYVVSQSDIAESAASMHSSGERATISDVWSGNTGYMSSAAKKLGHVYRRPTVESMSGSRIHVVLNTRSRYYRNLISSHLSLVLTCPCPPPVLLCPCLSGRPAYLYEYGVCISYLSSPHFTVQGT